MSYIEISVFLYLRAPKKPGKEQQPASDLKEGKRVLEGEAANVEGKGGVQGGAVVPGVRRAAAVTAFRLEDGQYKVSQGRISQLYDRL